VRHGRLHQAPDVAAVNPELLEALKSSDAVLFDGTFWSGDDLTVVRPGARTPWENLVLAGDWTATGLPATLESAVRSGNRAAEVVMIGNIKV